MHQNKWSDRLVDRRSWVDAMSRRGFSCKFDDVHSGNSTVTDWHAAGQVGIGEVDLAWQCLSPVRNASSWNGEALYLKVVQRGSVTIEHNGQEHRYEEGSVILLDPSRAFKDCYRKPARLAILSIPKKGLRDRGLRDSFHELYTPDLASPDVKAVRDFILSMARQAGEVSQGLLARFGDQCLDLLEVLIDDSAVSARGRISAATVFRAKQVIARLVGDPHLSVERIAAELNLSASQLTRTLKAHNLSPMRYAWSLRLEHAARLLARAPKDAIQAKEIAYRCGFASAAHFSRAFKERYGMSPRAYAAYRKAVSAESADYPAIVEAAVGNGGI